MCGGAPIKKSLVRVPLVTVKNYEVGRICACVGGPTAKIGPWYPYRNYKGHSQSSKITRYDQWRRSQVKSGGINIEKIEGVGPGEGLCPPQLGVWGLVPGKKINFALKNYAILSKFWYFFHILQQKVGGLSPPVLKVGDLSPCPPPLLRKQVSNTLQQTGQKHFVSVASHTK